MTHVFEKEIQALLRGERLQFDHQNDPEGWEYFDPYLHGHAASCLLSGRTEVYRWRDKPRTVKIGNREVEVPVLDPGTLETVWAWDSDYCRPSEHLAGSDVAADQYALGLCFASCEACQAAHDAIHALLRGEAC